MVSLVLMSIRFVLTQDLHFYSLSRLCQVKAKFLLPFSFITVLRTHKHFENMFKTFVFLMPSNLWCSGNIVLLLITNFKTPQLFGVPHNIYPWPSTILFTDNHDVLFGTKWYGFPAYIVNLFIKAYRRLRTKRI